MRFTLKPLAFAALTCLALGACQDGDDQVRTAKSSAHTTPDAAVAASIAAMKDNDLKAMVIASVPPDMVEHLRTNWTKDMNEKPITDEDRAKFKEGMEKFTADGAEEQIWTELQPKLKELQAEAQLQLPMWIGMGQGMLGMMVDESKDMTDAQKAQAKQGIQAFGRWANDAKFLDDELAKKSIGIVCDAARDLELESLDQVQALTFDQALDKGSIAVRATKDLLANYGFRVDDVIGTMKPQIVSEQGDAAKVKVSYSIFETPLEFETDMVRIGNAWYSKESVEKIRAEMAGSGDSAKAEDGVSAES